MTHLASGYGIARWSPGLPETLLITDLTGTILDSCHIAAPGDRPRQDTLWRTGWAPYPGTEWHEEPHRQWTRAVLHMPAVAENGQRKDHGRSARRT
jgi:hypothetical protein